jgi:carbonic anhydrase
MKTLIEGVKQFQAEVFAAQKELFSQLAHGQHPRALFITCSDSRIDPCMLTQTHPGDLFILRNAGNIVPTYGSTLGGSTATIEYAASVLKVREIIVCGHTDCGVMKALLHPETADKLPAVRSWMGQAEATRRIIEENFSHETGEALLLRTIQENVRVQFAHLRTHPAVAVRLRRRDLALHGWVYSIPTGQVWVLDEDREQFVDLAGPAAPR